MQNGIYPLCSLIYPKVVLIYPQSILFYPKRLLIYPKATEIYPLYKNTQKCLLPRKKASPVSAAMRNTPAEI
ncbi:hypothetical protein C4588_06370 [Candidatus Parcubacteria bacterium]|nr:MAG: hypothetical protein C4588_06370 [Candidatus Parcubacteria bacterium]